MFKRVYKWIMNASPWERCMEKYEIWQDTKSTSFMRAHQRYLNKHKPAKRVRRKDLEIN